MQVKLTFQTLGKEERSRLSQTLGLLDHARLNKTEVEYSPQERRVVIYLNRLGWREKRILWTRFRIGEPKESTRCRLIIWDVEQMEVHDEHPERTEVSVSVEAQEDEIYIGSSCEHGNGFGITLKVKGINFSLDDV